MKDESATCSIQKRFWQRRWATLLVFGMVAFLAFLGLEGVLYYLSPNADGNLVSFVCTSSSGDNAFQVKAKINLTDGMDQNEAMEVASKVLFEITRQIGGQQLQLLSENSSYDAEGTWTVMFTLGAHVYDASRTYGGSEATPHTLRTYVMTIDLFDKTVKYTG